MIIAEEYYYSRCVFLYITLNFVKKFDVTDVKKSRKSEGFDRKSRP